MFHVALVDDETELLYSLKIILEAEGWKVSAFSDAEAALDSFKAEMPDIIILDIIMPGQNGLWLCGKIRDISNNVPLIFLSAKADEMDRIVGLETGGDDYLCKPFSTRELIARIRVQKRRIEHLSGDGSRTVLVHSGFSLDRNTMTVSKNEEKAALTPSEYEILSRLISRAGTICTREELLETVYSRDIFISDRVIDNHIKRIRSKIGNISGEADIIGTVYGIGYRWGEK